MSYVIKFAHFVSFRMKNETHEESRAVERCQAAEASVSKTTRSSERQEVLNKIKKQDLIWSSA